MKRCMILALCILLAVTMTGCRGYTDASVQIPSGWAEYTAGDLTFRFEAGWKEADAATLQEGISGGVSIFADQTESSMIRAFQSPSREQGTVDYLFISRYEMREKTTAEDLEQIMDPLNSVARTIKNEAGLVTEIEQNARIRHYGSVDALTVCYSLSNEQSGYLVQLALVPEETTVYQIAYCDFTQIKDDSTLEAILSSLSTEKEK